MLVALDAAVAAAAEVASASPAAAVAAVANPSAAAVADAGAVVVSAQAAAVAVEPTTAAGIGWSPAPKGMQVRPKRIPTEGAATVVLEALQKLDMVAAVVARGHLFMLTEGSSDALVLQSVKRRLHTACGGRLPQAPTWHGCVTIMKEVSARLMDAITPSSIIADAYTLSRKWRGWYRTAKRIQTASARAAAWRGASAAVEPDASEAAVVADDAGAAAAAAVADAEDAGAAAAVALPPPSDAAAVADADMSQAMAAVWDAEDTSPIHPSATPPDAATDEEEAVFPPGFFDDATPKAAAVAEGEAAAVAPQEDGESDSSYTYMDADEAAELQIEQHSLADHDGAAAAEVAPEAGCGRGGQSAQSGGCGRRVRAQGGCGRRGHACAGGGCGRHDVPSVYVCPPERPGIHAGRQSVTPVVAHRARVDSLQK